MRGHGGVRLFHGCTVMCVSSNNISMNILYTGEAVWCTHFAGVLLTAGSIQQDAGNVFMLSRWCKVEELAWEGH